MELIIAIVLGFMILLIILILCIDKLLRMIKINENDNLIKNINRLDEIKNSQ